MAYGISYRMLFPHFNYKNIRDEEAARIAMKSVSSHYACTELRYAAIEQGSGDNVSVVVVDFSSIK